MMPTTSDIRADSDGRPFAGAPTGWICPRCGTVNAPWTMKCECSPIKPTEPWNPPWTGDPLPPPPITTC